MTCCDSKRSINDSALGPSPSFAACVPGALAGGLTRARYFDGMVLTQADLESEQRYWMLKRRLTNRALGTGVVWGLRVGWDANRRSFALGPGYALDCCGNDLVVECATEVAESQLLGTADPKLLPVDKFRAVSATSRLTEALLALQYVECPEDARLVHADACQPPSNRCEPSRIRETTRLVLVPGPPAPAPTCFDKVVTELEALKQSITDGRLRDALFPPAAPSSATPQPASALLPARLRVTTPGAGALTDYTVQPPAMGSVEGPPVISGRRSPDGMLAGVVQFELTPSPDWGFYQGEVRDGSTVVDRVAPPLDLQQFWSLELVLQEGTESEPRPFRFVVDRLGLEQMLGDRSRGMANLEIEGRVSATITEDGAVETRVEGLRIHVRSELADAAPTRRCLDGFGLSSFFAQPGRSAEHAKVLVLAALYAYFSDLSRASGNAWTPARLVAARLYVVAWRLLGVDANAAGSAQQLEELSRILARLFACLCEALVYPGPRCADDQHGVYLGRVTLNAGRIVSFDMHEQRRHVLLGPLVNHWLGVFGLAAPDVVAERFAQTICCFARSPAAGALSHGGGASVPLGRGALSIRPAAEASASVREIDLSELVARMGSALTADAHAPLTRYRARLGSGLVVELTAPAEAAEHPSAAAPKLEHEVTTLLRRSNGMVPSLRGVAVTAGANELARAVPPSALLDLSAASARLAARLTAREQTLAQLIELGPAGLLQLERDADPNAVDELSGRASAALQVIVEVLAKAARATKDARPSAVLRDSKLRESVVADLTAHLAFEKEAMTAALERAASGAP